jgi:hypothetical protein
MKLEKIAEQTVVAGSGMDIGVVGRPCASTT